MSCLHLGKIPFTQKAQKKVRVIPHDENPDTPNSERTYTIISNAQLVIAFWDGKSQGTNDMINYARMKGKQFKIKYFKVESEE